VAVAIRSGGADEVEAAGVGGQLMRRLLDEGLRRSGREKDDDLGERIVHYEPVSALVVEQ